MKIAIDAADLCDERIDGTRIYIKNVLDHLGGVGEKDSFFIYLKGEINKELDFKKFPNYSPKRSSAYFFWTQLKLSSELRRDNPQVLWMPLQTIPFFMDKKIKTVVTIHDLAFKFFPDHFPPKDRFLLSLFTRKAIEGATKIIAVSENTKKDIQEQFGVKEEKIKVIYHGYNKQLFNPTRAKDRSEITAVKNKYRITGDYILYTGAIQPRKNLNVLIKAFEDLKGNATHKDKKLVIAGAKAWMYQEVVKQIEFSQYKKDIIMTGPYETKELPWLLGGARVFVFPSLYEGFGIPVLEAMACGTPVVCSSNSSLPEVGGDAPEYFDAQSFSELSAKLKMVLENEELRETMRSKGLNRAEKFSWEKCARMTWETLKDAGN